MASQLPCPNPTCTHVFTAQEIQTADLVKCPRCSRAFRFRPPSAAPAAAPPPPAKPAGPAKKPAAAPVAQTSPAVAKPVAPVAKAAAVAVPLAPAARVAIAAPVVAPRPAVPMAAPVAPVVAPVVKPIAPASPGSVDVEAFDQPVALPDPAPADPFDTAPAPTFEDHGPLVRSRGVVKHTWTTKHYVVIGVGFVLLASIVTGAVLFGRKIFNPRDDDGGGVHGRIFYVRNLKEKDEKCFTFAVDNRRWTVDNNLKQRLQALTAWKHNEADAWVAVAVQDYGQQRPRDGELMKVAIERLESNFGDALELANKTFKSELAGEECSCLRFKGTSNSVVWFGECYLLAHHGFGYWMFVGSTSRWNNPEDAAHFKAELEKAKSFALVTERRGWREQPPKMDTYHAQSGLVSISVPSGTWEKSPAKDVEETGELFLFGRFLREKDNRKNASILVFTADKKSDLKESLREARSYLEKRQQEENDKYKFMVAQEGLSESGGIEPVGDRSGSIAELKLMLGDEPKRYTQLAVVHHEEKALVIRCDCTWEHRQIWQQDFRKAMETLKFARKE